MSRIYSYMSKYSGRQYNIERVNNGWLLSEWSHGGLLIAKTKAECVAYREVVDHYSKDGRGNIEDPNTGEPLPVVTFK